MALPVPAGCRFTRMMRRTFAAVVAAALTWTMTSTAAEAATTEIGAVSDINGTQSPATETAGSSGVQVSTSPGFSYVVPAGYGVITKLRHRTGSVSGTLAFKVYRPTAANTYVVVASEARQVAVGVTHTFDVRIPVQAGDVLGLSSTTVETAFPALPSDVVGLTTPPDAAPGQAATITPGGGSSYRLDVSAVLESDADADGFGDDTQDLCPADKGSAAKCLNTTIDKAPTKKVLTSTSKAKVKLKFSSPDAGVSFQCSVDGKAFKACVSPFKKKYKVGKHTVSVRAVTAAGAADPTPAVTTFKVKRKPATK
jgi:hypothetical protein